MTTRKLTQDNAVNRSSNGHQYKVLIADDHPIFCSGLKTLIEQAQRYQVVLMASSGIQAWSDYQQLMPDIVVLDISMGEMSGLQVARQILSLNKNALCVIMTMYCEEAFCHEALSMGVKGYLLKDDTTAAIIECLDTLVAGDIYISKSLSCIDPKAIKKHDMSLAKQIKLLSSKEKMILSAVAELKTNKEIATSLNLSVRTVQNHRQNICNKLNVSGRQALLQFAIAWAKQY